MKKIGRVLVQIVFLSHKAKDKNCYVKRIFSILADIDNLAQARKCDMELKLKSPYGLCLAALHPKEPRKSERQQTEAGEDRAGANAIKDAHPR
jgi:hypothetical protein